MSYKITPMVTKRVTPNYGIVLAVLSLVILIGGCTYKWGREFLADESSREATVEGWRLKPEVYSFKNVAGPEPMSDEFVIRLDLYLPRPIKDVVLVV